ncbi:MAG: 5-amino-6-(D-ribitylamino)uracil--L-tyrosine 4-hydroxyphenyl transferase CofH, partial [Gammaproteobacteria bacterium]
MLIEASAGTAGHGPGTTWPRLADDAALALAGASDLQALMHEAQALNRLGHGNVVSYSRKVFLPLTRLCRDVCHYCTFATTPSKVGPAYLSIERMIEIAETGRSAGCHEALFTLGDKPELRYRAAREALERMGFATTLEYLAEAARQVHAATGLLAHLNPGVMTRTELQELRAVSVSMGIMLETTADRLGDKGGPHHGSPDKVPALRLQTIADAGELGIAFTTGILIGIGETRRERIEALLAIRDLHERYGHIQEVIVQNFRAKADTPMHSAPEPSLEDHQWTLAVARLVLGPDMNIQAPPNLSPGALQPLLDTGINDWGGVSPVTPDHVNPEAPWPHLRTLERETEKGGRVLAARLAIYPSYVQAPGRWLDERWRTPVLQMSDASGYVRVDDWSPGALTVPPRDATANANRGAQTYAIDAQLSTVLDRGERGEQLSENEIVRMFQARGSEVAAVCDTADRIRRDVCGDEVTYVVNRNINYTNVCYFKCRFCAFSKGRLSENLRGDPYFLEPTEIARRVSEAWSRGATEVCLQGGIHPDYTGETYLEICRTVKAAAPEMHVHAFSPLEITQGALTLGISIPELLQRLREAGLGSLPGTAAEVLDDEVRAVLCPDKINTEQWLQVMEAAHAMGLRTTATIMFGHVDKPVHWARHLLAVRALQARTGGFTEFVPLPFVHMEAPIYLKGGARKGPTFTEALLMHAVARIALHPHIANIQASWVKMGPQGVSRALSAGVNDLGGTLMNETITRAAGAAHGQELGPAALRALINGAGRRLRQRTTLYGP